MSPPIITRSRGCQRPVGPLIRDSREQKRPLFLAGGGFAGSGGSLAIAQRLQRLKPSRCPPSAQGSERRATIGRDDRSRNNLCGRPRQGNGGRVGARGRAPRGGPESEGQGHPANPRVTPTPAPGPLLPPCFIGRPRGGGPPCPGACDPSRGGSDDREWGGVAAPPCGAPGRMPRRTRRTGPGPRRRRRRRQGPRPALPRLTPAVSADLPRSRLHPGAHAAGVPGRPGPQPGVPVVVQEGVGHLSLLEEEVVRQVRGPVPPSSSARRANSDPLPFPAAPRRRGRVFRPLWPTRKRPKHNSS